MTCPRCREDRLVSTSVMHGRVEYCCDVCSHVWRAEDELVICAACRREYYMQPPGRTLCLICDVSGNPITGP